MVAGIVTGVILLIFLCIGILLGFRIKRKRVRRLNTLRRPRPFLLRSEYAEDASSHTESLLSHRSSMDVSSFRSFIQTPPEVPFSPGSPTCVQNSDEETSPRPLRANGRTHSLWKPPIINRPTVPPPLPLHEDWAAPPPLSPPARVVWTDHQLPPPYRLLDSR